MSPLQRVVLLAPAKINLFLDIVGSRADGYHLVDTVMQAVGLCDVLVVGRRAQPGIRVTCSVPGIPEDSRNLVYRAAEAYTQSTGDDIDGLHIHIDKIIPSQAGLGGGSADAAAVLVGLNELCGAGLSGDRLRAIGLSLGVDVPFFIAGGCARAQGVGEQLEPLPSPLPPCHIVVAKPAAGISTQAAYRAYDAAPVAQRREIGGILEPISRGDLAGTCGQLFNVFEQVAPDPTTQAIQSALRAQGARGTLLTGSGSAVFGVFDDAAAAANSVRRLPQEIASVQETFLCSPVPHGVQILHRS